MHEDVAALADALDGHSGATPREQRSVGIIRRHLTWLPAPFDRDADPVHVTGSAIILDGAGRTLLHRHRRLGLWLQPGGHLDAGESPVDAALRESAEETGVPVRHPDGGPRLVHVDVHEGGRGHLHLDIRYLLLGDGSAPFAPAPGESDELAWVEVDRIGAFGDASVSEAVHAAVRATG